MACRVLVDETFGKIAGGFPGVEETVVCGVKRKGCNIKEFTRTGEGLRSRGFRAPRQAVGRRNATVFAQHTSHSSCLPKSSCLENFRVRQGVGLPSIKTLDARRHWGLNIALDAHEGLYRYIQDKIATLCHWFLFAALHYGVVFTSIVVPFVGIRSSTRASGMRE